MDASNRIFALLDIQGLEQKKFADLVGTTDKTVSAWKTGRSKSFTKYITTIAEVLGTTTEYLLTGKNPSPIPDDTVIRVKGRHSLTADAMEVAFAYDNASPDIRAAVRRVLAIEDRSFPAKSTHPDEAM